MIEKKLLAYQNYLIKWIISKTKQAKKKGVILGISGGMDSAYTAFLAKKAFHNHSLGVFIDIENEQSVINNYEIVKNFINIKTIFLSLNGEFNHLKQKLNLKNKLSIANLKARLRMTAIYSLAQENDFLVLGTDNLAEMTIGYFTKFGDGACDLAPLSKLPKENIINFLKINKFPKQIYKQKPSANLWKGQEDEKEIGIKYSQIDAFLNNKKINEKAKNKILNLHKNSNHKRKMPLQPKSFI